MRPSALVEPADMLAAITLGVGFFGVAVDQAVSGQRLATALARLATSVAFGVFAMNSADNLAALLELPARDRAHTRLHIGVQGVRGRVAGCINFRPLRVGSGDPVCFSACALSCLRHVFVLLPASRYVMACQA